MFNCIDLSNVLSETIFKLVLNVSEFLTSSFSNPLINYCNHIIVNYIIVKLKTILTQNGEFTKNVSQILFLNVSNISINTFFSNYPCFSGIGFCLDLRRSFSGFCFFRDGGSVRAGAHHVVLVLVTSGLARIRRHHWTKF